MLQPSCELRLAFLYTSVYVGYVNVRSYAAYLPVPSISLDPFIVLLVSFYFFFFFFLLLVFTLKSRKSPTIQFILFNYVHRESAWSDLKAVTW